MRNEGFTILEILVSIAIFTVVVAAILTMLPGVARTNSRTTEEQRVLIAAKAYFEKVRGEMRSNFDVSPTTITVPGVGNGLACTTAAAQVLETVGGQAALKRVTLSCTINNRTYPFTLDIGRTS